jgi:polyisoprenoid-binding protein YceI
MIKNLIAIIVAIAIAVPSVSAATWEIDKAHSSVGFTVKHMVISNVNGKFGDFSGTINFDGKDFASATVVVSINPASINTGNDYRDKHLKSPDFFAADSLPQMGFKSKKVIAGKDGAFQIVGDLTMRGVTKEVTLDAMFNGTVKGMQGDTRAGFSATTTINRQDWGVSWSKTLDSGGLVVSNDVKIALEVEAIQKQ